MNTRHRTGMMGLGTIVGILGDKLSRPIKRDKDLEREADKENWLKQARGLPHQGQKERLRRRAQLAKAELKANRFRVMEDGNG